MILKKNSPKEAIIHSYQRPILYENVIILDGISIKKHVINTKNISLACTGACTLNKKGNYISAIPFVTSEGFKPSTS